MKEKTVLGRIYHSWSQFLSVRKRRRTSGDDATFYPEDEEDEWPGAALIRGEVTVRYRGRE
jgi:hypothetical protein